ncbi:MAG: hypothetical protein ACR2H3_05915 [Acidimicrobiales bacterium]
MRSRLIAAIAAGLMLLGAGGAMASTPDGSSESNNNVSCRGQARADNFTVGGGAGGAVVCSDNGAIQGRAYVDVNRRAVGIDGDRDNQPAQLQGYILIDADGNQGCGPAADGSGNRDSESGNASAEECQPD